MTKRVSDNILILMFGLLTLAHCNTSYAGFVRGDKEMLLRDKMQFKTIDRQVIGVDGLPVLDAPLGSIALSPNDVYIRDVSIWAPLQRRVSGTCLSTQKVTGINSDGSVICEADIDTDTDTDTTYNAGTGLTLSGNTFNLNYDHSIYCQTDGTNCPSFTDTDTTYTAGTGLTLTGTEFSLNYDHSGLQNRVTGTCAAGSSIRIINEDGTVTCESDDAGVGSNYTAGDGLQLVNDEFSIDRTVPITAENSYLGSAPFTGTWPVTLTHKNNIADTTKYHVLGDGEYGSLWLNSFGNGDIFFAHNNVNQAIIYDNGNMDFFGGIYANSLFQNGNAVQERVTGTCNGMRNTSDLTTLKDSFSIVTGINADGTMNCVNIGITTSSPLFIAETGTVYQDDNVFHILSFDEAAIEHPTTQICYWKETKPYGSDGGSSVGGWNYRDMEVVNTNGTTDDNADCPFMQQYLSYDRIQFTDYGKYRFQCWAVAHEPDENMLTLYDYDYPYSTVATGMAQFAQNSADGQSVSHLDAIVEVTATDYYYRLRHYIQGAKSGNGFGARTFHGDTSIDNTFASCTITKLE